MNPITTSPLEAFHDGNPGAPAYAPNPAVDPAGLPTPGQPFGQPVIPQNFAIPSSQPSYIQPQSQPQPTGQPDADFARQLDAARQQAMVPSQQSQSQQPAQQNQQASAAGTDAQPSDPSAWTPSNRRKASQWDELKDSFAKKEAAWKQEREQLLAGKIPATATAGDLTKLPFDQLVTHPEVAKLKKERDEFFEDVRLIRTEKDPEFVAKFTAQREGVIKNLKFSVGGTGFEKIDKLLAEPASPYRDERIEQAMDGWKDATKARVHAAIATLDQVEFSRSAEAAQRAASWESRQANAYRESEQRREHQQAQIQQIFENQLAQWQDPQNGMPYYQKTGDPRQDAVVDANVGLARQILAGNQTPEQLARYAMWAASAQRIYQQNEALMVELQKFQQQDTRFRESFPSTGPAGWSVAEQQRQSANGHAFPATWNPADPFAGAAAFEQGLEAARQAEFSRGR